MKKILKACFIFDSYSFKCPCVSLEAIGLSALDTQLNEQNM